MREVRMTFGEHLEELRWRIIVSLFWLVLGVTIAFIFGEDLMQLALRPHQYAFKVARGNQLIERMNSTIADLHGALLSPEQSALEGKPLAEEGEIVRWEVLFVGTVTRSILDRRLGALAEPFDELAAACGELQSLPQTERDAFAAAVKQAGLGLADQLVEQFAPTLEIAGMEDVPQRFTRLSQNIERFEERRGSAGQMLEKLGWGEDIGEVRKELDKITKFFKVKRDAAKKLADDGGIELEEVREWVVGSSLDTATGKRMAALVPRLRRVLGKLEADFDEIENVEDPEANRIMVISYLENFYNYLRVVLIFGVIITIPFILYEMWKFIGAGLHLSEQKYVVTFLPFSLALFAVGMFFGYRIMIPVGLRFLASWASENVDLAFTLGNYIGLFITLTLILGIVFQTPLVMVFLTKLGIVEVDTYRRYRRISIFLGLCLAVVLTPPDPFSWSLMMAPMWLLYELGIIVCVLMTRKRTEETS